jgi:hypothetical protein
MFYHFTSREHLEQIRADGMIRPTDSNVGSPFPEMRPYGVHIGPSVVWLLDTPEVGYDHGLSGSVQDKTAVRISVNVPAVRWLHWQHAAPMHPEWRRRLVEIGGGEEAAAHWYVWPASIRSRHWAAVDILKGE